MQDFHVEISHVSSRDHHSKFTIEIGLKGAGMEVT